PDCREDMMSKYTLMLREDGQTFTKFSPAEMQAIIAPNGAWGDELQRNGKFAAGHKLRDGQGRIMRRNGAKIVVTDGPFAEGKEVIGGLFVVAARRRAQGGPIGNSCPHLEFGSIEVREVEVTPRP